VRWARDEPCGTLTGAAGRKGIALEAATPPGPPQTVTVTGAPVTPGSAYASRRLKKTPASRSRRCDFFSLALSKSRSGDGSCCSNSRHGGWVLTTAEMGRGNAIEATKIDDRRRIVLRRENYRSAIFDFCNSIGQEETSAIR
jgi:hypothetical protein